MIADPGQHLPDNRMNDRRTDPAGRWVGSMRDPQDGRRRARSTASRPTGRCTAMVAGLVTSNGLAFSPDGRILYHSDSHPSVRTVWAWDFDVAEEDRQPADLHRYPWHEGAARRGLLRCRRLLLDDEAMTAGRSCA
jgi:sugar lactone lactonase YvrE